MCGGFSIAMSTYRPCRVLRVPTQEQPLRMVSHGIHDCLLHTFLVGLLHFVGSGFSLLGHLVRGMRGSCSLPCDICTSSLAPTITLWWEWGTEEWHGLLLMVKYDFPMFMISFFWHDFPHCHSSKIGFRILKILREAQITSIIGSIGEDDPTGFWLTAPPAYMAYTFSDHSINMAFF